MPPANERDAFIVHTQAGSYVKYWRIGPNINGVRSLELAFLHDPTDCGVVQSCMLGRFWLAVVE